MDQNDFLVAFATVPGIGSVRLWLLLEYFGSPEKAWTAAEPDLRRVGLPKDALQELLTQRQKIKPYEYAESVRKRGIKMITILDPDYPDRLRNIPDPPNVLFIKSNLEVSEINILTRQKIVAVVGTRKMTPYGKDITSKLTEGLVANGFTIVSGLALGVDGVAHGTTINSGGKTIAVLGAGVDVIYPREHKDLYQEILDHDGVIMSEVAPEKRVIKGIFPARNRIVSGLSEAVLVTEGAIDSGSLITARAALDQGREVFAVPGPINSVMAEGTNYLLKQGAKLVTKVEDILEGLGYEAIGGPQRIVGKQVKGEREGEQKVLDRLLSEGEMEFDDLLAGLKISVAEAQKVLLDLEIRGVVRSTGTKWRIG